MGESVKGETYLRIAKHRNGSLENLKFRAKLEIQKFFEDDGGEFGGGFTMPPNWKPVTDSEGPKLYIQTGSKMNDRQDDDEPF
jgi:replicative DNA helicase